MVSGTLLLPKVLMVALALLIATVCPTASSLEPKLFSIFQFLRMALRLALVPPPPCILSTGDPEKLLAPMLVK